MSDYLARLAGRVREASPVLRPLGPSFFESPITSVATWPEMERIEIQHSLTSARETVGTEVVPAPDVLPRTSHSESSFKPPPERTRKPESDEPARTHVSEILQRVAVQRQIVTPTTSESTSLSVSSTAHQPIAAEQTFRSQPQDQSVPPSRESIRPVLETRGPASPLPQMARPDPKNASTTVPLRQSPTTQAAEQTSSPEPARPLPALEQARSSLKLEPHVDPCGPAQQRVQQAPSVETSSSAPPTSMTPGLAEVQARVGAPAPAMPEIHVTIGRIEVRAISSPTPIQKATPLGRPELSLDDYLRSRNKRTA
jgi:hypothetical protein